MTEKPSKRQVFRDFNREDCDEANCQLPRGHEGDHEPFPDADILWSLRNFQMLSIGGTWGVPRSGLIFRKEDTKTLALVAKVPTSPEYLEQQRADFNAIRRRHKAARITVVDKTNEYPPGFDTDPSSPGYTG